MTRATYCAFMAAAAIMAGALVAAPVWDHFHYGRPAAADRPTTPITLAAGSGMSPSPPSDPSVEPAAPWTPADESQARLPDGSVQDMSPLEHSSPSASAAPPPGPSAARHAADAAPPRASAPPPGRRADAGGSLPDGGTQQERPSPAANPQETITWAGGGIVAGSTVPPAPAPRSTPAIPDRSGQNADTRPSGTSAPEPEEPSSPRLSLAPDRREIVRGETFSVQVMLTGARDITSVPFHLLFDPEVLQYVGARTGPALDGRSLQPIFLASVNPSRPGDLAVGLSLVRSSGRFSGSGAIVLIDFLALAPGTSNLVFDRATLRGAASEPLSAEIVGSSAEVRR